MLLLHIIVAVASLIFSSYLYISPSKGKLPAAYTLVGLTLASGTYIALTQSVNMLQVCLSGLLYLAAVSAALLAARHKLATASAK